MDRLINRFLHCWPVSYLHISYQQSDKRWVASPAVMTGRVATDTPSSMHVVCPVLKKGQNDVNHFYNISL